MPRMSIDNQISEIKNDSVRKIGDVLRDALASLPPNRMVTKVLLDGRPILNSSSNTGQDILENFLGEQNALEISTIDREIWSASGIDIALSCLEKVQRSLIRVAELFTENKIEAHQFFVQCIDGLERFYEAVMITRSVLRLDFDSIL